VEPPAPSIFVATVPLAAERLRAILAGRRVYCARKYADAARALSRERYALAILGIYFDESRMFDVLAHARGSAKNANTPVVCVLGMRGRLSRLLIRSLEQTLNAMPRTTFLNLAAIPDDPDGNAFVRSFLASHLAPRAAPQSPQDLVVT
jgi:hypothetical protein